MQQIQSQNVACVNNLYIDGCWSTDINGRTVLQDYVQATLTREISRNQHGSKNGPLRRKQKKS